MPMHMLCVIVQLLYTNKRCFSSVCTYVVTFCLQCAVFCVITVYHVHMFVLKLCICPAIYIR